MRIFLTILFFCFSISSFSQGEAWNWLIWDSVGLYFPNGKAPVITNHYKANFITEGNSSISSKSGRLLFYGNLQWFYDSNGNAINSTLFYSHSSSSQPLMFIHHPKSPEYHCFSNGAGSSSKFCYSIINVGVSSASIKQLNQILLYRGTERQSAVNHKNGIDIWVVTHGAYSDSIFAFLIDSSGLISCPVAIKAGLTQGPNSAMSQGCMKFSTDGKYMAFASIFPSSRVELFRFDNETGIFYDPISLNVYAPWGIEFSKDATKLYVTADNLKSLYQFDLSQYNQTAIQNSKTLIDTVSQYLQLDALQLAPDGKIYLSNVDTFFLSVINNPDSLGAKCNFQYMGLNLGRPKKHAGLPGFNQSYFYHPSSDFKYQLNCTDNSIRLNASDTFNANSYTWRFKHLPTSNASTSSGKVLTHAFSDTGSYEMRLIASNGSFNDTTIKTITIYPKFIPDFLGKDTFYCSGDTISLQLSTPINLHCIEWHDGSSSPTFNADTAGTYIVNICNQSFCRFSDTFIIEERALPSQPVLVQHHDTLKSFYIDSDKYTWTKNGGPISGDSSYLKISQIGIYRLTVSKNGCSVESDPLSVTQVGIYEFKTEQINVYPNPTSGLLHVDIKEPGSYQIEVYDAIGRLITMQNTNISSEISFDLSLVKHQFVLIRISKNGNPLVQQKIIIEHQ